MKLVVGLGNPGRQYVGTRHNVGYDVVDRFAGEIGCQFRRQFDGQLASVKLAGDVLLLFKPETFMNNSGQPLRKLVDFYNIAQDQLLIVCDDLNLPVGTIRVRAQGSDGGQKGLRSIAQHLGSTQYPRMRLGIGAGPEGTDASNHVLSRFSSHDRPLIDECVQRAAHAIRVWSEKGITECMNQCNRAADD